MSEVAMPEKKNKTKSLFQAGGAVVGAVYGGPTGAMMGAQAGGMASDMTQPKGGGPEATPSGGGGEAMARRTETYQNPSGDLAAAQKATAQMPPAEQKKVGPILRRAQQLSEQERTA